MPETNTRETKEDFVALTGLLRVLEKRILTTSDMDKLAVADGFGETLKTLSQASDYDFSGAARPEDYETALNAALRGMYAELYAKCQNPIPMDIPAAKYDYHNLKTALKAKALGRLLAPRPYMDIAGTPAEAVEHAVITGDYTGLPEHLAEAAAKGADAFADGSDPRAMDIELDKLLLARMLGLCQRLGNGFITEYTRVCADAYNIRVLLRLSAMGANNSSRGKHSSREVILAQGSMARNSLAEGGFINPDALAEGLAEPGSVGDAAGSGSSAAAGVVAVVARSDYYDKFFGERLKLAAAGFKKTGSSAEVERFFDNALIQRLQQSKYIAYGPEIPFSYVLSRENEARQIRILLTCKLNGIPADTIRERLRDNYA